MNKLVFVTILFSLLTQVARASSIDTGSGADGVCDSAALNAGGSKTYNCTSVNITLVHTLTGSTALVFKSQGAVSISGTINVSATNNATNGGGNGASIFPGGTSGPGGSDGASYPGGSAAGSTGDGAGAGAGGAGASNGLNETGSGGGGGAGHGAVGAVGANGTQTGGGTPGNGGAAGVNYSNDLNVTLVGGSGGGSAGSGNDAFTYYAGGTGGGGGGAFKIAAAGAITVSATSSIMAEGGLGGNGFGGTALSESGAGGSGSGGTIFMQSLESITVAGTLAVRGGAAVASATTEGGAGGAGGQGRIRMDTANGSSGVDIANGTILPGALSIEYFTIFVEKPVNEFKSSVGCGTINTGGGSSGGPWRFYLSFLFGVFILMLGKKLLKLKSTT